MRIRWKYLICINGILIAIWGLYIATEQIWDRKDMLHIEARSLQKQARILKRVGFDGGAPRAALGEILKQMVGESAGMEIMVLDAGSVIRFSSVAGRVGQRWKEKKIEWVIKKRRAATWQYKDHYHGDIAMLDVTVPVVDRSGRTRYAIHVARRLDLVEELLRDHRLRHAAWALLSTILIGLVLSLVTDRWLIRPINSMTKILSTSRWYGANRRPGDELQRLLETIRQMVQQAEVAVEQKEGLLIQVKSFNEKLEKEILRVREELTLTQAELVRKERLSAIGELAAGLAHELRNPLHIIRGAAELLARRAENREASQDVLEEVDRINRFVNDLLAYTRPMEPRKEGVSVAPIISAVVLSIKRIRGGEPGRDFEVECSEDLEMEMDGAHLHQVLTNLVSNALEATPEQGEVCIRASREARATRLSVEDTGCGIAAEDLERIFDPFYTRRPAGTGLGLAIVRRLVEMYGGTVEARSRRGLGTTVTVRLPVHADAAAGEGPEDREES